MNYDASNCTLCPRRCGADRRECAGVCRAPDSAVVHSAFLHRFEEPVISGSDSARGSGAVFFSGCTMRCVYCQNAEISRRAEGESFTPERLAGLFLSLRDRGAYNINLVSPTPYVPYITEALDICGDELGIPIVYNTGGWENAQTVRALEGYVGVWLTDFKYADDDLAHRYSGAENYRETALEALREEVGQSASAEYYFDGKSKLMRRGVIVRHLCLPGHRRDTEAVLRLLAAEFDPGEITLSLMRQYTPGFAPPQYRELSRRVTSFEYEFALDLAGELGFSGFSQEKNSASCAYTPDFAGKGGEVGKNFG